MVRPTKLTPDIQKKIVELIEEGQFAEIAANCVGISERTFYNCLKRGKNEEHGPFFQFFQAIEQASAKSEVEALDIIWIASERDWRAAAWYLERRFPKKWGKRQRNEVSDLSVYPTQLDIEDIREKLIKKLETYQK